MIEVFNKFVKLRILLMRSRRGLYVWKKVGRWRKLCKKRIRRLAI
jgi:hypothetical protein